MTVQTIVRRGMLATVAGVSLVATAGNPKPADPPKPAADTTVIDSRAPKLGEVDLQVLAHVHHSDMTEVKAGKLAMDRAADKRVKGFGKMLVDDHGSDARMILSMVSKRGQVLPDMKPMDEAEKADLQLTNDTMAKLDELHGKDFDREFLLAQVAMHDKTLAKLDLEITQIKDNPDLVQMLRNNRPVIVKHKQEAQALLGVIGGNEYERK